MSPANLEWWVYTAITLSIFIGCLILNYIVKVINDARLEDRYIRILQKTSTNQGTQVHCPPAEITARNNRVPLDNMLEKSNTTPNKISLVFNKEENLHDTKKMEDISDEDSELSIQLKNNTAGTKSCESIGKPILLGNIYSDVIPNMGKQKKEADDQIIDNLSYVNEDRPGINTRTQNYQDLRQWIVGLVTRVTDNHE